MHVFQVAFYVAGVYYALFIDTSALIPFLVVVGLYLVVSALLPRATNISTRKKIMLSTWSHPSEPNIFVRIPVRTEKVQKIIDSSPKENRLSLTYFCIKAVGELLVTQPFLNGTLSLGKFIPYETVDVSCLVDIGGGKDLAMLCIRGVDKMSIQDIASYVKAKAAKMKKSDGGEEHKNQMKPFKLVPAFLVSFMIEVMSFIANKLGIGFPAFKIEKHALGAGCVTSLGTLGFQDATAPFTGFANCSILLAANAVGDQPVVEDGKVAVGKVMNCNFTVDHRYIDGANCTRLVPVFRSVFEEPEKFMDKQMKNLKQ